MAGTAESRVWGWIVSPSLIAAQAIQRALRQRGVFYTHPTEGTADVFTTESMATLIEEAYAAQVKPLVWEQLGVTLWRARRGRLDIAQIQCQPDGRFFLRLETNPDFYQQPSEHQLYPTLEAAQAAAQEEWAAFILSALQ